VKNNVFLQFSPRFGWNGLTPPIQPYFGKETFGFLLKTRAVSRLLLLAMAYQNQKMRGDF